MIQQNDDKYINEILPLFDSSFLLSTSLNYHSEPQIADSCIASNLKSNPTTHLILEPIITMARIKHTGPKKPVEPDPVPCKPAPSTKKTKNQVSQPAKMRRSATSTFSKDTIILYESIIYGIGNKVSHGSILLTQPRETPSHLLSPLGGPQGCCQGSFYQSACRQNAAWSTHSQNRCYSPSTCRPS